MKSGFFLKKNIQINKIFPKHKLSFNFVVNEVKPLLTAKKIGVYSFAILGFNGGKCLNYADSPIHFLIDDMQIAEDTQLIVGHLCMQWLTRNKPTFMD